MITDVVTTSLLLSAGQVLLLLAFFRPAQGLPRVRLAVLLAGGVLVLSLARGLETADGLMRYVSMAFLYGVMVLLVRLWSGESQQTKGIAQRVFCFFLLTECATLVLSYVSMILFGLDFFRRGPLLRQFAAVAALTALHGALFALMLRRFPPEICADNSTLRFSLLSALPYLFCCQLAFWLPIDNDDVTPVVPLITAAGCLLALMLIANMEARLYAEKEKRQALAQQHMLELRQQQFVLRRDSIEAVRRTYHDMKNLLLYLEQSTPPREDVRAQLQGILQESRGCEALLSTGNEVTDILLSEKLAVCQREGIACTVMVDGALLAFIGQLDLVSLVGNAMDNAIEACCALPPEAARYIQVRTHERPGFVLLHFLNSCTGEARCEEGRFLTLKPDAENHGFGLSSICLAAQRYGGEMSCRMEDGEFSLTLVFPKP